MVVNRVEVMDSVRKADLIQFIADRSIDPIEILSENFFPVEQIEIGKTEIPWGVDEENKIKTLFCRWCPNH